VNSLPHIGHFKEAYSAIDLFNRACEAEVDLIFRTAVEALPINFPQASQGLVKSSILNRRYSIIQKVNVQTTL
jgi:hypothetical protein